MPVSHTPPIPRPAAARRTRRACACRHHIQQQAPAQAQAQGGLEHGRMCVHAAARPRQPVCMLVMADSPHAEGCGRVRAGRCCGIRANDVGRHSLLAVSQGGCAARPASSTSTCLERLVLRLYGGLRSARRPEVLNLQQPTRGEVRQVATAGRRVTVAWRGGLPTAASAFP